MKLNSTNKIVYKTTDYGTFNFPDNFIYREPFYDYLKESISQKNLLIDCPILIDNNFNIVDGCYRLLVAKSLGIELFYRFTENKRIDHINIKDVRDKVLAEDYLVYYKDNINYRMLASELDKFKKLIPKRDFLELMGVNSKSRTSFGIFKKGEYLFTEHCEETCKRLMILLNEYEWTKEPYNAIYEIYSLGNYGCDLYDGELMLDLLNKYPNYIEKYKLLLSENKIKPQFDLFMEDLYQFDKHKPLSTKSIINQSSTYKGENFETIVTFKTLMLIDKLYETSDTLVMS
jgi:hypothetical protein